MFLFQFIFVYFNVDVFGCGHVDAVSHKNVSVVSVDESFFSERDLQRPASNEHVSETHLEDAR